MTDILIVQECCESFFDSKREASSNYGIDSYGKVGLCVDEADRVWTSGNLTIHKMFQATSCLVPYLEARMIDT